MPKRFFSLCPSPLAMAHTYTLRATVDYLRITIGINRNAENAVRKHFSGWARLFRCDVGVVAEFLCVQVKWRRRFSGWMDWRYIINAPRVICAPKPIFIEYMVRADDANKYRFVGKKEQKKKLTTSPKSHSSCIIIKSNVCYVCE